MRMVSDPCSYQHRKHWLGAGQKPHTCLLFHLPHSSVAKGPKESINPKGVMPTQILTLTSCFFESYSTSIAITPGGGASQSLPLGIDLYVSSLGRTLDFRALFLWSPMVPSLAKGQ